MEFNQIKSVDGLENASKEAKWQVFEGLVSYIFEQNGFNVKVNVVKIFGKKRRQYDVIAENKGRTFIVDCKKWKRNNLSAIKKEIKKHKERCLLLDKNAVPLIVTLVEENVQEYEGVFVVPIHRLNSFLNEINI